MPTTGLHGSAAAGSSGIVLPNAAKYPPLHRALGKVLSGTSDATILIIGDSISSGLFTTNIGPGITTAMVRILANALGIPVTEGLGVALNTSAAGPDNRWTLGTGWSWGSSTFANLSWGGLPTTGAGLVGANAAAGTASFQPQAGTFDTFDVYYIGTTTTFNVNFNGGANTGTGSGSGVQKVTVSGAATSRPVCNFNTVAGALGTMIIGVDPRLSTTPTLRLGNAGMTASDTSQWAGGGSLGNGSPMQCVVVYNPDVVLVNLGTNDVQHGLSLPTSIASWQTLAGIATSAFIQGGAGGIMFASECPTNPGITGGGQLPAYWAQLKAFCAQNGYGFIDIYNGLNGQAGFAALSAMNPSWYGDGNSIHPSTNPGSPDYGRMLAQGLLAL